MDCAGSSAERSYLTSKARGSDRECQAVKVQERPRGATTHPRSRAAAERSYPTSKVRSGGQEEQSHIHVVVAAQVQEGQEELLHLKVRRGNLVQGKEQWLYFAGAAMKRYPTSKVRETQVRW